MASLGNLALVLLKDPAWNYTRKGAIGKIHIIAFDLVASAIVKRSTPPWPAEMSGIASPSGVEWTDTDTLFLKMWFEKAHGVNLNTNLCKEVLEVVSSRNAYDPRLIDREQAIEPGIDELNKEYAVAQLGATTVIIHEAYDPDFNHTGIEYVSEKSFDLRYRNRPVKIPDGRTISLAAFWLKHKDRRQFERIIFDPARKPDPRYYNLWKGWSVTPAPGDWSLLKTHIWTDFCDKSEEVFRYFMAWMADAIQNPTVRPGVALVLRGKRGTGKGKFWEHFSALYGSHALQVNQSSQVTGKFNAHLQNCLLLNADEACWAGDHEAEGTLKGLITEKRLTVERKGVDSVEARCYVRLIMTSNESWVFPAAPEERRALILDVSEAHMQRGEYFAAIDAQMMSGGREAMLYELQEMDISSFDLRNIPQTKALLEQKILSLSPIPRFWMGRLMSGAPVPGREFGDWVPTSELHELYLKEAQVAGEKRRKVEMEFNAEIKKLCPELEYDRVTVNSAEREPGWSGRRTVRAWSFRLPSLDKARKLFDSYMRYPIDWPAYSADIAQPAQQRD